MENKKLNGFNNGRDTTNGVGGKEGYAISHMAIEDKEGFLVIDVNSVSETTLNELTKAFTEKKASIIKSTVTLQEAIKVLQKHLREDKSEGSYYHSWMCNLKMIIFDTLTANGVDILDIEKERLSISEEAAINFLELLIK